MKSIIRNIFNVSALVVIILYLISGILISVVKTEDKTVRNELGYFSGKGTEKSPYLISNSLELFEFSELVNSGNEFRNTYFEQTQDLNIEDIEQFKPIGQYDSTHYFYGIYDGAGYSISNLNLNGEGTNVALFAVLGGTVKNLGIESGVIQGGCIGSIASHSIGNEAKIINCYNKATIIADERAGGIADNFGGGKIINCWNEGNLEAPITGGVSSYTANVIYNSYCIQENIVNKYFNGTLTFLSGKYSQSRNEIVQKMNNGVEAAIYDFELKEGTLIQWKLSNKNIIFKNE